MSFIIETSKIDFPHQVVKDPKSLKWESMGKTFNNSRDAWEEYKILCKSSDTHYFRIKKTNDKKK